MLKPKCLSKYDPQGLGHSAQGYLLPCCFMDAYPLERGIAQDIFYQEKLKISNNDNITDIIQSKEVKYDIKSGESDCGFFVFKTSKIRNLIKNLINKKMIMTKKSNEIDFLSSFKFIRKIGKITTIKAKNNKDTIGINSKKDLI